MDRTQDSCHLQPLRVKLDPGSKRTGIALVRESETIDLQSGQFKRRATVLLLMELAHRGRQISEALTARHCRLIQRNDGYGYHYSPATISDPVVSAKNPKCTDAVHPPLYLPA